MDKFDNLMNLPKNLSTSRKIIIFMMDLIHSLFVMFVLIGPYFITNMYVPATLLLFIANGVTNYKLGLCFWSTLTNKIAGISKCSSFSDRYFNWYPTTQSSWEEKTCEEHNLTEENSRSFSFYEFVLMVNITYVLYRMYKIYKINYIPNNLTVFLASIYLIGFIVSLNLNWISEPI